MKLFNGGAYLVNGTDIVADSPEAGALLQQKTGHTVTKEDAKKAFALYTTGGLNTPLLGEYT